ncbi:MAG: RNA polymerase subunit sigma [Planctomycetes bacterium]|nr:RNA polymerase subunit sigma [Planctomycetota bacterium]
MPPDDITRLLANVADGREAVDLLLPAVYTELRHRAEGLLFGRDRGGANPTSFVHEAYLKLVDQTRASYKSRLHFLAVAALAMRRLLVDRARHDRAQKRGGGAVRESVDCSTLGVGPAATDPIDLDAALTKLAATEPRAAELVQLRFFGGLTMDEAAQHLGVSTPTAERDWRFARAWLYRELAP